MSVLPCDSLEAVDEMVRENEKHLIVRHYEHPAEY